MFCLSRINNAESNSAFYVAEKSAKLSAKMEGVGASATD